jgi:hypothetical protein
MSSTPAAPAQASTLTTSEAARIRSNYAGLTLRRDRLWRAPHFERNAVIAFIVGAILANLLWVVGLDLVMHPLERSTGHRDAIQVSVIEPVEEIEVPPEPQPQPVVFQRRPSKVAIAPPETRMTPPPLNSGSSSQTQARIGASGEPSVKLFNADGSLRLPETKTRIGPETIENPQEAAKARWAEIEKRGENPLDCKRTRFAHQFRRDESAGDTVARKYLSWIGLADHAGIAERAAQREGRAADGCDPPG